MVTTPRCCALLRRDHLLEAVESAGEFSFEKWALAEKSLAIRDSDEKPTKHMVLINIYYMYFTIFYPHYWWIWWLRNREVAYCHVVIDDISGSDCLILSGKWGQRCTVWGDKWDVVFAGTLQLRTPWVRCMWELLRLHLLYPGTFPYLSEMSPGVDANGSTILELRHVIRSPKHTDCPIKSQPVETWQNVGWAKSLPSGNLT